MLSAQTPHSPKLRYGGEISHDGVQCFTWDFALVCLFRPPFLEVEIKNQQDWRIIYITIKIMRPCRRRLPTYKRRIKNEKNNFMLTGDVRNVFIRKYYFFDSISDIAGRYSFSESEVKNMLYHSRNRLREYLKKAGVEV